MKEKMKTGFLQLKIDIQNSYIWMLAILAYMILTNLIFGSVCAMVIVTGVPCPACGLTRAGISLITLHFIDAWNYNCVIFLIVPFVLYCLSCRYWFQCKCRGVLPSLIIIVICLICLYIYRMIHYFPDVSPMVYHENNIVCFLKQVCFHIINR